MVSISFHNEVHSCGQWEYLIRMYSKQSFFICVKTAFFSFIAFTSYDFFCITMVEKMSNVHFVMALNIHCSFSFSFSLCCCLRYLSSFILLRCLKKNPWHPTLKSKFIINVARSEAIHFDLLYYLQIIQNVTCEIGYHYLTRLYGLCVLSVFCNSSFILSSSIFQNFFLFSIYEKNHYIVGVSRGLRMNFCSAPFSHST